MGSGSSAEPTLGKVIISIIRERHPPCTRRCLPAACRRRRCLPPLPAAAAATPLSQLTPSPTLSR